MAVNNSGESRPVYKYFRGKWKELGSDKKSLPRIKESEYNVKDLETKSVLELEELIIRQEKLLQNKLFLSKLKDKGEKIKVKYEDLQNALKIAKVRSECKNSEINNLHQEDIESIEWNGVNTTLVSNKIYSHSNYRGILEDSDEEESNPLQLLATHSVDYPCTIRNRLENEEEDTSRLIEKALEKLNIEDSQTSTEDQNENSDENLKEKVDENYFGQKLLNNLNEKQKFNKKRKLFKTNRPKSWVKSESQTTVKVIPIEESLKLMSEACKNEEIKIYSDAAKALKNSGPIGMTLPSTNYLNYRDTNSPQHFLENVDDDDVISESLYFGRVTED